MTARLARLRADLVGELGPLPAALAIVLAGVGLMVAVCWPLGMAIARLQAQVDLPLFASAQDILGQDPTGWLATLSGHVTKMGDLLPMALVATSASLFFAVLWRRRGWWVPALMIFGTLALEVSTQRLLAVVVDRGHPPTALGTYPSGGSARLVAVGGVIAYFVILTWPGLPARVRVLLWVVVALLGAAEGFTRIYLLQHYPADVPAGWILGALLLLTMTASASALVARRSDLPEGPEISLAS